MESDRDDKNAQSGEEGGRKWPLLSNFEDQLVVCQQDDHLEIKAARKREQNRKAQIKYRLLRGNDQDFKKQQNLKRRQKRLSLSKEELEIKRRKDAIKRRKYRKDPTSGVGVFIETDSCDIKTENIDEYPYETTKLAVDQNYDVSSLNGELNLNYERIEFHDIKIEETNLNDTTNNIVEKQDEDSIEKIKAKKRELNRKYQLKHRLSKKNDLEYIKQENLRRKQKRLSLSKKELEERRKKEAARQKHYRLLKKQDDFNEVDGVKQKNSGKEEGEIININNYCDSQSLGVDVDNLINIDNYHFKEEAEIELNSNYEKCDYSDIKKDLIGDTFGSNDNNSAPTDGNSKEQNKESIERAKKREQNRKYQIKHRLLKGKDYLKKESLRRKKKRMSLSKEDLEKLRKKEALKRKILRAKNSQYCKIVYSDTEKQGKEDYTENENLEINFDECYIYDIETGQIVANLEDDEEDPNNQDLIDFTTNDSNRSVVIHCQLEG